MRKLRFFYFYLLTLIKRRQRVILFIIVIPFLVLGLFFKFHQKIFKPVITEGIVGTFTEDNLSPMVTSLLSQGLVKIDQHLLPQPNLVKNWDVSSDASTYTLHLKPNLYWTDGSRVLASDIKVDVEDATITTPDASTIQIKLNDSFSPLPSLLSGPVIKKGTLIGLGPYQVTSLEKTSIFIKKLTLHTLEPGLPDVVVRFYPNETVASEALKKGEVQALLGVPQTQEFSGEHPFVTMSQTNYQKLVAIFYNSQDSILSDKNFRLALSFAAPSIKGEQVATTSIPPTSWAFNPDVKDYLDNPTEAKTSLDKVKSGKDTTIVLTATSSLEGVGQQVVDEWNREGIKATLRPESGIPQNFQALLITQDIPSDPDQYALWHSTQMQTNISKYSSPRIDKDLEDGRKTADQSVRKQRYQDFQKILLDDSPATFLYFPKFDVVALRKVEDDLKKVLHVQLPNLGF